MRICVIALISVSILFGLEHFAFSQISPVEIGHINEFPGYSVQNGQYVDEDVTVTGHCICVANATGTYIYDVSNPRQAQRLNSVFPGYGTFYQIISGDLLFQATGTGWDIISISNLANPVMLSSTNISGGNVSGIAASGNYAYVAADQQGLCIYDISNPFSPVLVGQTDLSGQDLGVGLYGHYAYASTFGDGLHVFDVSDPTNLVRVGQVATGGASLSGYSMTFHGNYLYLADGFDGLHIFDISNPSSPTSVGRVQVGEYAERVAVAGNYAYVAEYTSGLRICDISNPAKPTLLPGTNTNYGANSASLAVSSNYVYLANGGDGLRIYSLSTPAPPRLSLNRSQANDLLSWAAPTAGFVLQQSPALSGTNWITVTNLSTVVSNQNQISLSASTNAVFYRLKFP